MIITEIEACPFCKIVHEDTESRIVHKNDLAFVIRDIYPVSDGHTLIILNRHIASFFDATEAEQRALLNLMNQVKTAFDKEYNPSAYNIGINDGPAAGQTVPHLHIHLIPRYEGDLDDPTGGVRGVIPEKQKY